MDRSATGQQFTKPDILNQEALRRAETITGQTPATSAIDAWLQELKETDRELDYLMALSSNDSSRLPKVTSKSERYQKHPAVFQCNLCPKRFTRAYNLRSHLRAHTEERPFVCTVCGKAFARQHDRKRHESLHSGEKKLVCKGQLKDGSRWGCGRRFARVDALGRHFRSEAGRICTKPLFDEEATKRQDEETKDQLQARAIAKLARPHLGPENTTRDIWPAALLQQYPALGEIDWNAIAQGPPPDEDWEFQGGLDRRSSFEASSGGEEWGQMFGSHSSRSSAEDKHLSDQFESKSSYGTGLMEAFPSFPTHGTPGVQLPANDFYDWSTLLEDFEPHAGLDSRTLAFSASSAADQPEVPTSRELKSEAVKPTAKKKEDSL